MVKKQSARMMVPDSLDDELDNAPDYPVDEDVEDKPPVEDAPDYDKEPF